MNDINAVQLEQNSVISDDLEDLDATIKPPPKLENQERKEDEPLQYRQVQTIPNSTPSTFSNPFLNPFTQVVPGKSLLSTMNPPVRSQDTRKRDTGHETQEMMDVYGTLGGTPHKTEYEEWRKPPSLDGSGDSLLGNGRPRSNFERHDPIHQVT